jgi:hypothetical protein
VANVSKVQKLLTSHIIKFSNFAYVQDWIYVISYFGRLTCDNSVMLLGIKVFWDNLYNITSFFEVTNFNFD